MALLACKRCVLAGKRESRQIVIEKDIVFPRNGIVTIAATIP